MPTLKNWEIVNYCGSIFYAKGMVYNHSRLRDGDSISTSQIVKVVSSDSENRYYLETYAGSLYELDKDDMNPEYKQDTIKNLGYVGVTEVDDDKVPAIIDEIKLNIEKSKREKEAAFIRSENLAKEAMDIKDMYIAMSDSFEPRKVIYKDVNGDYYDIEPDYHVGMFSDSVLLTLYELDPPSDFRFFPRWSSIEPYVWSEVEKIYIYNCGRDAYGVNDMARISNVNCKPGMITVIEKAYTEKNNEYYKVENVYSV